ncbi:hypothetical protein DFH07DRAFT_934684 [Mycena maculata]|uniref:Reverse transcriptase domain-containing protein n=1 Tax=Mycena maculata TaxID=230809 RepID=A0AAD7H7S6_9AGAR|nr:hypothetical protein DFH07DRAFT_934684 [Mycena maculata]
MKGAQSDVFHSDIGVLIGDPVSSTFWDLFFADFKLHPDPDDVLLLNVAMSHLEHADDMAVVSYTADGLQRHLTTFVRWCGNNMLEANASKSWIMVFGPLPKSLPTFLLNDLTIGYTDCFCYVGVTFESTAKNIFASHYTAKASAVSRAGHSVLGIEAYIGDLPPKEGRLLYMACIDPHLVSGADIIIDVDDKSLAHLEKVQHAFLCHLLGLGAYSMCAPLFTELGLVPLCYRRLILALRYLGYLINLAATHYAKAALEDSYQLYLKGCQGDWMDLVYALQNLWFPVTLPALPELTPEKYTALTKEVHIVAMRHLDAEMLHDRLEPLEDEPPKKMTAFLRHYLVLVVNTKHRKALTRLLVSQHRLAVERMCYKQQVIVPREDRLCRFGCNHIEMVEHALFFCSQAGEELLQYCNAYTTAMQTTDPRIATVALWNATNVLRSLIF